MPRIHYYQSAFNAGEFTKRLLGRTDFEKYLSAVDTMENMLPLPEGGAMRRSGSRYVAEVANSAKKTRLKRFEFSTTQAYIIEMGDLYMRFYRNQGQIVSEDITASISNGNFDSGISGWTDESTGSGASISHDSTNNRMLLTSDALDTAVADQEVTNTVATEHVIKVRVDNTAGLNTVKLRIGTTSGATDILNDFNLQAGYHAIAFTPETGNFFVQFRHLSSTGTFSAAVDNISLIDDSAIELETP